MTVADKKLKKRAASLPSNSQVLSREQLEIINWLERVKFRKQLFGGVSEEDVWKKIQQLNEMYDAALKAERIRYDVLLEQQSKDIHLTQQTGNLTKEDFVDE